MNRIIRWLGIAIFTLKQALLGYYWHSVWHGEQQ